MMSSELRSKIRKRLTPYDTPLKLPKCRTISGEITLPPPMIACQEIEPHKNENSGRGKGTIEAKHPPPLLSNSPPPLRSLKTHTRHADAQDTDPDDRQTNPGCMSCGSGRSTPGAPWTRRPRTLPGRWCTRPRRRSPSPRRGRRTCPCVAWAASSLPTTSCRGRRPRGRVRERRRGPRACWLRGSRGGRGWIVVVVALVAPWAAGARGRLR